MNHVDQSGLDGREGKAMDQELKSYLTEQFTGMRGEIKNTETRLRTEMENTETRLRTEIKKTETSLRTEIEKTETSLRAEIKTTETRLRTEIEKTETKLLSAFHGWARPMEIRHRGTLATVSGFDERSLSAEERISELERARPKSS